jgi:hypothetical protein
MVITGAVLIACTTLTAGCGGSPSSTGTRSSASQASVQGPYAYARCMRAHGLSNFPDPHVVSHDGQTSVSQMLPQSAAAAPAFKSAQKACQHFQPTPQSGPGPGDQQHHKQVLLAFARCLRAHGLTGFPDPNAQGQLTLAMINAAGVDIHGPGFFTAAKACVGATHGAITLAQVAQAARGNH